MLDRIQSQLTRYLPLLIGLIWGAAVVLLDLVRFTPYAIDEGAAMGLLLNWSVSDQIISPVGVLGVPDFRAILFIPLGLYWSGSMVAAKIYMLALSFVTVWLLYLWSREQHDGETALIASGLMLIAPLTLIQIDGLGVGPFLLLMFALGRWLDRKYRSVERAINSWYFVQAILVAITVTLHPAGLAYPLVLAWHWQRHPVTRRRKTQVWISLALPSLVMLAMQAGWVALDGFANPLTALAQLISSTGDPDPAAVNSAWGLLPAALALLVLRYDARRLMQDTLGSMVVAGIVIGLCAADAGWAMLVLALLLYRGVPLLIAFNQKLSRGGFFGQRGLVMIMLVVLATWFMQLDKAYRLQILTNLLSPQDELIQSLALEAEDADEDFLAASEWPARSILAVRHNVLPLPPARDSGEALLDSITGLDFVMFDHHNPANTALARNLAELAGETETLVVQPGGVIIHILDESATPRPAPHTGDPAVKPDSM